MCVQDYGTPLAQAITVEIWKQFTSVNELIPIFNSQMQELDMLLCLLKASMHSLQDISLTCLFNIINTHIQVFKVLT